LQQRRFLAFWFSLSRRPLHESSLTKRQLAKHAPGVVARLIPNAPTESVELLIGPAGSINPVPAAQIRALNPEAVLAYCHKYGIYQIPTLELITWIARYTANRNSLEICAGMGDLGRILGIRSSDSYMHLFPIVREAYERMQQPITAPPSSVEKLEALEAVKKYNPEVVIASWASEFSATPIPGRRTSPFGIHERQIWEHGSVDTYIVIGNHEVHDKRLPHLTPHEAVEGAPWLVSRAFDQKANFAYVWKK